MTVSFIQRALNRPRFLILVFLLAGLPGLFSPHANATNFETAAIPHEMDDYSSSLAQWQPLAEQGDVIAQLNLGLMYRDGKGVPQDHVAAAKWYRRAAEQGLALAQFTLALFYGNGVGVPLDFIAAHMWINLAASNGIELAVEYRDVLASTMPPEALTRAEALARQCLASNYQDCGE